MLGRFSDQMRAAPLARLEADMKFSIVMICLCQRNCKNKFSVSSEVSAQDDTSQIYIPPAAGRLQYFQFCQAGLGCANPNKCRMKDEQKIIFVRQGVTCSWQVTCLAETRKMSFCISRRNLLLYSAVPVKPSF